MLVPSNRLTFFDALRPPVSYQLDEAIAVTFTLDLRALLAAPAAFALSSSGRLADDDGGVEPIDLLHAVRTNADRISVFSQCGEIALPPSRRVFAFLEQSVVPVTAPRGGVVHPKVWVLRYQASDGVPEEEPQSVMRVIIASRNLTFDESWDTVVRLDQSFTDSGAVITPVGELFTSLLDCSVLSVPEVHRQRVRRFADRLQTARFALPTGITEAKVHVLGFAHPSFAFPSGATRSMVLSPFLSSDFFTKVHTTPVSEVISRAESLANLSAKASAGIGAAYTFDDGSTVDMDAKGVVDGGDPGRPLAGLHAKVFAFEFADVAAVYLGSANATGAAFRSNVEVLLEFKAPISVLGVDALCEGSSDDVGLRALFHLFVAGEVIDPEDAVLTLDAARRSIASLDFDGMVEAAGEGWQVTYRSTVPVPLIADVTVRCWPLSIPGHRTELAGGKPLDVRFESSLDAISGFLAFELTNEDGVSTAFVVPVPLRNVPEARDTALMKALVGNAERFFRYLMAMLDDAGDLGREQDKSVRTIAADSTQVGGATLPVLEKLLKTLRREPTKLAVLHPLVVDLDADGVLPAGFIALWEMLHDIGFGDDSW